MNTVFIPGARAKTIDEVCGEPTGSFNNFIVVSQVASRMVNRPATEVTLSVAEVEALLKRYPELEELGLAAHQ